MAVLDGYLAALGRRLGGRDFVAQRSAVIDVIVEDDEHRVGVLAELGPSEDNYSEVRQLGLNIPSGAGPSYIATGYVPLNALERLEAASGVVRVDVSRPTSRELEPIDPMDRFSIGPSGGGGGGEGGGKGVVIAIVDSGIDFRHPAFIDGGRSRVEAIWDQRLDRQGEEVSPSDFGYGVEYESAEIQLALTDPNAGVRHVDDPVDGQHGTAVASIAAGTVFTSGGSMIRGVAPQSAIVVVALRSDSPMAGIVDGLRWAVRKSAGRRLIVNLSTGIAAGSHDGRGLFERAIDDVVASGAVVVKAAGNRAGKAQHASGCADALGKFVSLSHGPLTTDAYVEVWYDSEHPLEFGVRRGEEGVAPIVMTTPGGFHTGWGSVLVEHSEDGARRSIRLWLRPSPGQQVPASNWELTFRAVDQAVVWHAWTGPMDDICLRPSSRDVTVTAPGTAASIIVVGGYRETTPSEPAAICTFSGQGPTRDGRQCVTLAAPGEEVPVAMGGTKLGRSMTGTSASAPVVSGACALILARYPHLTPLEVRALLVQSARDEGEVAAEGQERWGAGRLDIDAALKQAVLTSA